MKIQQFTGPFEKGQKLTLNLENESSADSLYLHIGFQIPFSKHVGSILFEEEHTHNKNGHYKERDYIPELDPDFTVKSYSKRANGMLINGFEQSFRITDRNILEFDGIADKNWIIEFHKKLPRESIIDIAYE